MNVVLPLTVALLLSPNGVGKALLPVPTSTEVRTLKCKAPDLPGHVTVVDGAIVRDYRGAGRDTAAAGSLLPDASEIYSVEVRCLRVRSAEMESGWALRSAVIVLSKSGAPKVAHAQLTELVEEQRLHLARTGKYAATILDLQFVDSRANLGVDMTVSSKGWSAVISLRELRVKCSVAVGEAVAADPELRAGVPVCVTAAAPEHNPVDLPF